MVVMNWVETILVDSAIVEVGMSVGRSMRSASHDHLNTPSQGTSVPICHLGQPAHPPTGHMLC